MQTLTIENTLTRLIQAEAITPDELSRWLTYAAVGLADDALYARAAGRDDEAAAKSGQAQRAALLAKLIGGE